MTVNTESRIDVVQGDDITLVFPLTYKLFAIEDVEVRLRASGGVIGSGVLQTLGADYLVSNLSAGSDQPFATVTMIVAPISGDEVEFSREVPYTQEQSIINQSGFFPQVIEEALDRAVMMIQQVSGILDTFIRFDTRQVPANPTLPFPLVDDTVMIWNDTDSRFDTGPSAGEISNANNSAIEAADSADAAAISETNAGISETNAQTAETNAETAETNAEASAALAAGFVGLGYIFSTNTSVGDPGAGVLRFNNATPASVTSIFIDNIDSFGADVSAYIDTWDDSTTVNPSRLILRSVIDQSKVIIYNITAVVDSTGFRTLTVTHISGTILFADAADLAITNAPSGDDGTGDMLVATYDPGGIADDAFDMDNMVEGSDTKIMTAAERSASAFAYVSILISATVPSIEDSLNVTSVTDIVEGRTAVNFTNNAAAADYGVTGCAGNSVFAAIIVGVQSDGRAVGTAQTYMRFHDGTAIDAEFSAFTFMGDLA